MSEIQLEGSILETTLDFAAAVVRMETGERRPDNDEWFVEDSVEVLKGKLLVVEELRTTLSEVLRFDELLRAPSRCFVGARIGRTGPSWSPLTLRPSRGRMRGGRGAAFSSTDASRK